jgi:hypothetical protein
MKQRTVCDKVTVPYVMREGRCFFNVVFVSASYPSRDGGQGTNARPPFLQIVSLAGTRWNLSGTARTPHLTRVRSSSRVEQVISSITQHTQLGITFSQNRNPNRNNHIFFDTIQQQHCQHERLNFLRSRQTNR